MSATISSTSGNNEIYAGDNWDKVEVGSGNDDVQVGDGSVDIHYDSNIWYDESYAANQGWPLNNKIVVSLGSEREVDKVLLNIWAGIKYKLSFYDEKFKPAVGIDSNGIEKELTPTIISAGNVDISNDPLKSAVEIVYGLSSRFIL